MFRALNCSGECAILLPLLLSLDVAVGSIVLMPKQAETILEYRSRDGLPEHGGWNRTLAGKGAGTVTAAIKNGLLDLRDESDGLDGLTYRKLIDPKWSEGMARDGWILELYLKVHGSTIQLDQEKQSAETCAVHLLDKDGEAARNLLLAGGP